MASREAYTQIQISHKFTIAQELQGKKKANHGSGNRRPVIRDQCWVDSIGKFCLFVLFSLGSV